MSDTYHFPFYEVQEGKRVLMEIIVEAESFDEAIIAAHDEMVRRDNA